MDQMAEMIPFIIEKFKLKRIYLFGVGVGSNIFLRYAVRLIIILSVLKQLN